MKKELYLGLYLGGIKKDKSALLVLERFKNQNRLVVSEIEKNFKKINLSHFPDEILKNQINQYENVKSIGVNFPLSKPACIDCELGCPGVKKCEVEEVKWLVKEYKKKSKLSSLSKKERKIPSPYTERALDYYVAHSLEEEFPMAPAFGSSRSAFYARGKFLRNGLKDQIFVETFPKVSLWRLGQKYGIRRSVLKNFNRSEKSIENRKLFLTKIEKDFFLYEEDKETIAQKKEVFEALLCSLSAYFLESQEVEPKKKAMSFIEQKFSLPT